MHVDPRTPTTKNPPEQFTGDVWLDPIASPREEGQRMIVAKVRFAPGARTAWHSHARGQPLHVTQGIAWVQSRGGEKVELHAGQTVTAPQVRSTGTAPRPTRSWSTWRCWTTPTTRPPPRRG
jgi:quercetin dioxygenase-like cupin family protein